MEDLSTARVGNTGDKNKRLQDSEQGYFTRLSAFLAVQFDSFMMLLEVLL